MSIKKSTSFTLIFILISLVTFSQNMNQKKEKHLTRILFMFDASNSMYGTWKNATKMESAKKLLISILDSLKSQKDLELALRVYGHQKPYPPQDCDDTKLEVEFYKNNIEEIKVKLRALKPSGTTPIAASLLKAADDFPASPSNTRNIIILITDGIEACEGDPCAVSQALQKKGIILKPFVIGIGGDNMDFRKAFECVGSYFDASTEEQFSTILGIVISQALNSTTAQVNLIDAFGNPSETNVNMTFYDEFSGAIKYNYVHTINNRGVPDTVLLDPVLTYKMMVHTIPPVEKKGIKLNPGKHNIIAVDCPQGSLMLKVMGSNEYKTLSYIVRKNKESQTLNVQQFYELEKYIIGKYDIEVLCLPRLYINDVDISQSKQTTIQIPQPGIANISCNGAGYGSLFVEENNQMRLIYNFKENLTSEKMLLQPGKYRIEYRSKAAHETIYCIEREFKIEPGTSVQVKLY